MQLVIGSTYESSRGFGRLLYLGETHGIDGYLPTFRTTKGEFKHYSYDQLPGALVEFASPTVSRADELIACLEGEIAKRDEELAACRVAVENCEVFRARIVELEARIVWLECEAQVNAAPVSEAKAQGVVMPEREVVTVAYGHDLGGNYTEGYSEGWNDCIDAVERLNAASVQQPKCKTCNDNGRIGGPSFYAPDEGGEPCPDCSAPVQQVSVPDVSAMARILADRNADACNVNREDNWAIHGQDYIDDVTAMLAAAMSAGKDSDQ